MKSTVFKNTTLLVFLLFASLVKAQMNTKQVDSLVNYAMSKFNVAGCAVAVVKDGKVIHNKGYGVKSIITKEPVNKHTQFAIASNSKAFTTAALAILVEEGKITWLDKVKDHIPEFRMYNQYVEDNFNIQDLVTHRSGLGLGMGDLMFFPDGADFKMEDLLSSFQYFKPESAFRTKWDYDNLLYLVAGELIARKSGMTWEEFITKNILKPLNMNNSYASLADVKDTSNLAASHTVENGNIRVIPTFKEMMNGAAGGIFSNVDDISQWMLLQLNKGKYGDSLNKQLFTEKSHREMWRIHTVMSTDPNPRYNSHFAGYGLGWFLSDVKGNMKVEHTGGLPGMLSNTVMIPDLNLGVVILTNTSDDGAGLFSAVANAITDDYLGLDNFNWVDKYANYFTQRTTGNDDFTKKVWDEVAAADASQIKQKNFIGFYRDNWFGKAEVFKKEGKLWIRFLRSPKLNGELQYYKENIFAVKWEYQDMNVDAFVTFALDKKGKAQGIKIKGISPNIDFSFDFQDLDLQRVKE
ncbi:CubicO group peptidase (beta-lactamase class C family) [Lacinutrix venerupis]|uniref:serine hydrolase n=1 Tax=Lacinutrix venerupis TaxID=1486034 RepID=UPI000EB58FAE|nr:serine hydrolase [Lacinutrix venerupis]RLJ62517.1 CubicO group peptidase (beta-lactamase class C family) [Lacinutrix venerupis]